jgi:D-amino-acid oxidase
MPSRREVLSGVALGLAGGRLLPGRDRRPKLARVNVSQDRVIRITVGQRPFRPSGFVVRAEKLDDKTVVHNYGHGGAGITLSWGTAQLAVNLAPPADGNECAVIGCGVVGLATARILQQRGYKPVIYARETPPGTTSSLAGGLWEPVSLFDHARVTPEFRQQYAEASRVAFRRYQSLAGDLYGVRWLPLFRLSQNPAGIQAPGPESPNSEVEPLYPEKAVLKHGEHPFQAAYVDRRYSMLIEPAIYLNTMMRDYLVNGGRIVIRAFREKRELAALPGNLIFNCTGLGARELFGDAELTPIRGQLVVLLPQPEVDYMTLGPGDIYMFPRRDGILLGGSFDRGVENTDVDPAVTERILRDSGALFGGMKG